MEYSSQRLTMRREIAYVRQYFREEVVKNIEKS